MPDRLRQRRPSTNHVLAAAVALSLTAAVTGYLWATNSPDRKPPANTAVTATLDIPDIVTIPGTTPRLPRLAGGQASLYIKNIGELGYASDNATPTPIASVAKIMTAYLTLRAHPLQPGQNGAAITITRAEADAYPREHAQDQSVVPIKAGETLTERQALTALMLPSANNVARILARWVAGSVPAFLTRMNAAATALDMTSTRYTDPSGFDPHTISTANDQIRLAEIALTIPAFAQIVSTKNAVIPLAGPIRNTNRLLGKYGIDGVKTGSTDAAGGNLVFTASAPIGAQSLRIIGAVLHQNKGLPQTFAQTQALVLAARNAIGPHTLIKAGQVVATTNGHIPLRAATDITVLGWPGLQYHAGLHLSTGTPTSAGAIAGQLELDGPGKPATTNLIAG